MDAFEIGFESEPVRHFEELVEWGFITLGSSRERFAAPIGFWSTSDYVAHWRAQLLKVVGGHPACLIVAMRDPRNANFIETWTCYPEGESTYFRNRLVFLGQDESDFSLEWLDETILPRLGDNGSRPSEWLVSRRAISAFLDQSARLGH